MGAGGILSRRGQGHAAGCWDACRAVPPPSPSPRPPSPLAIPGVRGTQGTRGAYPGPGPGTQCGGLFDSGWQGRQRVDTGRMRSQTPNKRVQAASLLECPAPCALRPRSVHMLRGRGKGTGTRGTGLAGLYWALGAPPAAAAQRDACYAADVRNGQMINLASTQHVARVK